MDLVTISFSVKISVAPAFIADGFSAYWQVFPWRTSFSVTISVAPALSLIDLVPVDKFSHLELVLLLK